MRWLKGHAWAPAVAWSILVVLVAIAVLQVDHNNQQRIRREGLAVCERQVAANAYFIIDAGQRVYRPRRLQAGAFRLFRLRDCHASSEKGRTVYLSPALALARIDAAADILGIQDWYRLREPRVTAVLDGKQFDPRDGE